MDYKGVTLDPFQEQAVRVINDQESLIVAAPTGAGKTLVAEYAIDEFNGLVENSQAFKANLIVERDPNDPNRVNVLYPPDLVNQLRIFAVLNQFRLQYNRGVDTGIIESNLTGGGAGLGGVPGA